MFTININNDQSFVCSEEETLFEAARSQMVKVPMHVHEEDVAIVK